MKKNPAMYIFLDNMKLPVRILKTKLHIFKTKPLITIDIKKKKFKLSNITKMKQNSRWKKRFYYFA